MRDRVKRKLTIEIDNLTEAQEIALNDLLATWQILGRNGASRWTAFFADGDGDFHPKITVNGEEPKFTELVGRDLLWPDDEYRMDYDSIGWALQAIEDRENPPEPYVPGPPIDWKNIPHFSIYGDGGTSCLQCGEKSNHPIHTLTEPLPNENAQLRPNEAESAG